MYRKSYCTTLGVGVGRDVRFGKMLTFFTLKFFYVKGKMLTGFRHSNDLCLKLLQCSTSIVTLC